MSVIKVNNNGGKGNEYRDSENGEFASPNGTGVSKKSYQAEVKESDNDLLQIAFSSDSRLKDKYESLPDDRKQAFVDKIRLLYGSDLTNNDINKRFKYMTESEFDSAGDACRNALFNKYGAKAQTYLNSFYNDYRGAGPDAFDFNHACRVGFENWFRMHPEYQYLQNRYEKWYEAFKGLTSAYGVDRDCQGFRYLNEDYICNLFPEQVANFDKYTDQWGYETIGQQKYSCSEIVKALEPTIGKELVGDAAASSFSMVDTNNVYQNAKPGDRRYRRIKIFCDIEKGQKCFLSNYNYESEALMPPKTSYYIKDIKVGHRPDGLEEVHIYYGIKR